jgi:predicted amidophosphoribosyltransferase
MDLLFPPRCVACAAEIGTRRRDVMLCSDCYSRLPLTDWPVCPRCAAPVPAAEGVQLACSHCRRDKLRFDRTVALGSYEGLLRQLIMG